MNLEQFEELRGEHQDQMPPAMFDIIAQSYAAIGTTKAIVRRRRGRPMRKRFHHALERAVARAFGKSGFACWGCGGGLTDTDHARLCNGCAQENEL